MEESNKRWTTYDSCHEEDCTHVQIDKIILLMGNHKRCHCSKEKCKIHTNKLENYIKDGRVAKLKSYSQKRDIDLKHIVLNKSRNLAHLCCKFSTTNSWQGCVLRFLIEEGVCCNAQDYKGDTPLHITLKMALKESSPLIIQTVYREMVVPQLEAFPALLEITNHKNITCRNLLDLLIQRMKQRDTSVHKSEFEEESERRKWNEKLHTAMQEELADEHGDDYFSGDFNEETENEWVERIGMEMRFKRQRRQSEKNHASCSSKESSENRHQSHAEEKLKKSRERMKKEYEEYQKQAAENRNRKRKQKYEKEIQKLFLVNSDTEICYDDIPWPSRSVEDLSSVLFSDLLNGDKDCYKKYLREQQIRWHPDKFVQKIGHLLREADKEKILERVKEISQELNRLSDIEL